MAFFGKKKITEETGVASTDVQAVTTIKTVAPISPHAVIVRPRITEKAALLIDNNVYTFEITKGATKYQVRDAIKAMYSVTPTAVHIVNKAPRHSMSRARGRDVMEHGLRKAYVYLKKGDKLDIV